MSSMTSQEVLAYSCISILWEPGVTLQEVYDRLLVAISAYDKGAAPYTRVARLTTQPLQ